MYKYSKHIKSQIPFIYQYTKFKVQVQNILSQNRIECVLGRPELMLPKKKNDRNTFPVSFFGLISKFLIRYSSCMVYLALYLPCVIF